MMNIFQNVSLHDYSTMRLGGAARYLAEIRSHQELSEALAWAEAQNISVMMVGGGSNIVWKDEGFDGLLLVNKIMRFETFDEDEQNTYTTVGAGEIWDSVVERTVRAGLTGIEALSLIPGTAGATPIQNVGAYGQELSQTLVTVEAYDRQRKTLVNIPSTDCAFGYRTSRFKAADKGRFFITAITLHLMKGSPQPPFYESTQKYFDEQGIKEITPEILRKAIISIRTSKLPDPAVVANNGSFFANPIIDQGSANQLLADYPEMTQWPTNDARVKVPAAWLIEQAGFKDYHDEETGMATWPKQPLVFVNEHAQTTADLLKFKQKIVAAVQAKFGIALEQEPELLP